MHTSTLITTLSFFAATGLAGYVLEDDYFEQGFFDQFSFFEGVDSNQGFVSYQNRDAANTSSLIEQSAEGVYLGVDHDNQTPDGRPSVRLTSNKSYQGGLIVANITHMPGGICGTWPAFWTVGPNWPNDGEIDIFEGVNDQTSNNITLHTGPDCTITNNGLFSGDMSSTYCGPTTENSGCQINANDDKSYGAGFNSAGGGIYATEWTDSEINIYFFSNSATAPTDILGDSPDPSTWGKPIASFSGDFDMATAFVDQQIVINTNFCGTWAGNAWSASSCATEQYPTCDSYVQANPAAFKEAYWMFAGLKVYQSGGNETTGTEPSATAPVYSSTSTSAAASSSSAPASSSTSVTAPSSSVSAYSSSSVAAPSTSAPAPTSYAAPSSSSAPFVSTYVATETSIVYVTVPVPSSTAAAESASGYTPVVGGYGSVVQEGYAATATPSSEEFFWSTAPDGDAVYGGRKREADGNVVKGRHVRHLGRHRGGEGRIW